jgi:hypothetical protein
MGLALHPFQGYEVKQNRASVASKRPDVSVGLRTDGAARQLEDVFGSIGRCHAEMLGGPPFYLFNRSAGTKPVVSPCSVEAYADGNNATAVDVCAERRTFVRLGKRRLWIEGFFEIFDEDKEFAFVVFRFTTLSRLFEYMVSMRIFMFDNNDLDIRDFFALQQDFNSFHLRHSFLSCDASEDPVYIAYT